MNDILPQDTPLWRYLEDTIQEVVSAYGYQEIRMPIVEQTELFKRSIGEVTDIVEKEMYSFLDRNEDSLTLRPEGTAGCVRAAEEHGLLFNQLQRLWYRGPMFRYERPQKGRYRQFHQIGVEAFGMEGPDIDAELVLMSHAILQQLGIDNATRLEINSLGSNRARHLYREALVEYLETYRNDLDADSQRRLDSNPLRILDSKNENTQELLASAPNFVDYLDAESAEHFAEFRTFLDTAGINYQVNPRLVRGLDYYCKTVFEWITDELGAQGTLCAGGRYDGLVQQLGGKATPAVGFAIGIERMVLMVQTLNLVPKDLDRVAEIFVAALGTEAVNKALTLAQRLRLEQPELRIQVNCGDGGFKSQLKRADKSGALLALIIGEDELQEGLVTLKPLRSGEAQRQVAESEIGPALRAFVWE